MNENKNRNINLNNLSRFKNRLIVTLTQAEYDLLSDKEKNSDTLYFISDDNAIMYKNKNYSMGVGNGIKIDTILDDTSENPVQNKTITNALNDKLNVSDISDWAKSDVKPVYTADEVGASDKNHTHNYAGSSSAGGAATTALACTGNSNTATKAEQDSEGQQINKTYIKGLSVLGKVINSIKGDGSIEEVGEIEITQGDIKDGNGAYQVPYLIQTGSVSVSNSVPTVTFATPYKSTPIVVCCTSSNYVTTTINNMASVSPKSISKTSFQPIAHNIQKSTSGTFSMLGDIATILWAAFGEI